MISLYSIYGEQNINKSKEELIDSIKSRSQIAPELLDDCIEITEEYLNRATKPTSENISIEHTLRVTLLMLSENVLDLFAAEAIFAVIMHDLLIYTNYSYDDAKNDFGDYTAYILSAYSSKQYTLSPLTLSIFVFDEIDNMLSANNLSPDERKRLNTKIKNKVEPILFKIRANKLLNCFKDALFFATESLKDIDNNNYLIIDKHLKQLNAFQSVGKSWAKIQEALIPDLFKVRVESPSIFQLYLQFGKNGINPDSFNQSDIIYNTVLIYTGSLYNFGYNNVKIIQSIMNNKNTHEYVIEKLTRDGFLLTDNFNNRFKVNIVDRNKYTDFLFGENFRYKYYDNDSEIFYEKNRINVCPPSSLNSKNYSEVRIDMPIHSTIVDYLLKYELDSCKHIIDVKMNGESVGFETELKRNAKIETIVDEKITKEIPLEWMMHCQTIDARKKMYDIISDKIRLLEDVRKRTIENCDNAITEKLSEIITLKKKIEHYENELSR